MLTRANVTAHDTVLVSGASGGVGSALIQLAKRRGATVVALASQSKHDALSSSGADALLPRSRENLGEAQQVAFGQNQVSVVADVVGGDAFSTLIHCLERGRYTTSGAIAGLIVSLDLRTLHLSDLTFTGSTVVPPHIFKDIVRYIERAEIKPMVAATFPLEKFHKAQSVFIDKQHTGNIVVTISE